MRKLYALAVVLLLAAPQTSQAVGSFSLLTSDVLAATTAGLESQSSVVKTSGLIFGSVTIGTAAVILELEEIGTSLQSPHHNALLLSGTDQTAWIQDGMALSALQQTAGGGNVSLSLNSIIAGASLQAQAASIDTHAFGVMGTGQGVGPELAFTMVMLNNPAFAVLNSFPVAQMLLVKQAITSVASVTTDHMWAQLGMGVAMDILNVGVSEFSPHHNVMFLDGTAFQTASVTSGTVLSAIQQQAGVANVQAAVNQISVNSGDWTAIAGSWRP